MSTILDLLMNQFRGDTVSIVASALGESPARVHVAIRGAVPAVLGGLARRASTTQGAVDLLDLLRRKKLNSLMRSNGPTALAMPSGIASLIETGKPMLAFTLDGRSASVTDWLTTYSGMKRSSSESLLSLVAPVTLGLIVKQMNMAGWNVPNLMKLLPGTQTWLKAAPAGLAGVLGHSGRAAGAVGAAAWFQGSNEPERSGRLSKVVLPVLLLSLLSYSLLRKPPVDTVPSAPEHVEANLSGPALGLTDVGAFIDITLPKGPTLHVPANGLESKLLDLISNPRSTANRDARLSFDRLEFESDSAVLKPSSQEQLRNIAEIMKAHPSVDIKLGGPVDGTVDEANTKLSQKRATTAMNAIVSMGIDRNRLSAEAYGGRSPVVNDRRIDIRVTQTSSLNER